jgi:hypothetical protein
MIYKPLTPGMKLSAFAKSAVLIYRIDGTAFTVPYANITQGEFIELTDDDFMVLQTVDGVLCLFAPYFDWEVLA